MDIRWTALTWAAISLNRLWAMNSLKMYAQTQLPCDSQMRCADLTMRQGTLLLQVKWKGYDDPADQTMEPEENLLYVIEHNSQRIAAILTSAIGRVQRIWLRSTTEFKVAVRKSQLPRSASRLEDPRRRPKRQHLRDKKNLMATLSEHQLQQQGRRTRMAIFTPTGHLIAKAGRMMCKALRPSCAKQTQASYTRISNGKMGGSRKYLLKHATKNARRR